jgi:GNAT superfamily N-acetyltransferase
VTVAFVIRPARAEDVALIEPWTQDTFAWGDYVSDVMGDWLTEPGSLVIVCVYEDDIPVAMSRVQLLSPTEAWLSAARVHPDHRRSGMGMAMNAFGVAWAKEQGARVASLATEEENEAARSQVLKSGYRLTGNWSYATAPMSTGRRLGTGERLRPGGTIDADAAWTFWAQSDLAQAARDMISLGWRWRRASRGDLEDAVNAHTFYHSPGGWLIAETDREGISVRWLATSPADAPLLVQGLRDLLRDQPGEPRVEAMVPVTAWSVEALQREGFEVTPIQIFSMGL